MQKLLRAYNTITENESANKLFGKALSAYEADMSEYYIIIWEFNNGKDM